MEPVVTREAALVLRNMITTCGSSGCFEAAKRLSEVRSETSLSALGTDNDGNWLMLVFQRLKWYAADEGLEVLDVADVVRYFGGTHHIRNMEAIASHAGLGQYLGKDVGLVTHVLLPVKGRSYSNEGHIVTFGKSLYLNPDEKGKLFYHLGAMVRIAVPDSVVHEILKQQADSAVFMKALARIDGTTIELPSEYLAGLNCTAEKSKELR